jgi:hypothetical protein
MGRHISQVRSEEEPHMENTNQIYKTSSPFPAIGMPALHQTEIHDPRQFAGK